MPSCNANLFLALAGCMKHPGLLWAQCDPEYYLRLFSLTLIYSKNNSYNTLESKYELKQYEKILINDSVKEIIQRIKQDLNSI